MAKKFYNAPTIQHAHQAATLQAAGLRDSPITLRLGISLHGLRTLRTHAEWPAILASKEQAIADLMGGRK